MNEEFKKALESLKSYYDSGGKYSDLTFHESGMLLNYITNLQEENLKLKNNMSGITMEEYTRALNNYQELKETNEEHRKINGDLRKENQKLVKVIEELEEYIKSCYIVGHTVQNASLDDILNKLTELKGGGDSEV